MERSPGPGRVAGSAGATWSRRRSAATRGQADGAAGRHPDDGARGPAAPPAPAARAAAPAPAAPTVTGVAAGVTEVPHTRCAGHRVAAAAEQADDAHFYVKRAVVVDQLLDLLRDLNECAPVPISLGDCVLKRVALAHVRVPAMNAIWTATRRGSLDTVDIAVAVVGSTADVLRRSSGDADRLNLGTISSSSRALASSAARGEARGGRLDGGGDHRDGPDGVHRRPGVRDRRPAAIVGPDRRGRDVGSTRRRAVGSPLSPRSTSCCRSTIA